MTIHQLSIFIENRSGTLIKVLEALKEANIQIIASTIADAISTFSQAGISIAYMYSFLLGGKGILVFRTDNPELARETILSGKLKYITEQDLQKLA